MPNSKDPISKNLEDSSLHGLRVLVTRPIAQAQSLVGLIQQYSGHSTLLPTVEINSLGITAQVRRSIENLDQYHAVIFISINAARIGCDLILDYWPQWPTGIHWIAVGNATAGVMAEFGLRALVPTVHDSDGLLGLSPLNRIDGNKILIVRGQGGREYLPDTLRLRGAIVDLAEVYERQMPSDKHSDILSTISPEKIDIVLITSVESLNNLCSLVGDGREDLQKISLLVASDRIAQVAEKAGFGKVGSSSVVISKGASDVAVLNGLRRFVDGRKDP